MLGAFLCVVFGVVWVVVVVFVLINLVIALWGGSYETPIENLRSFYGDIYTHFFGRSYVGVVLTLCLLCLILITYKLFCSGG